MQTVLVNPMGVPVRGAAKRKYKRVLASIPRTKGGRFMKAGRKAARSKGVAKRRRSVSIMRVVQHPVVVRANKRRRSRGRAVVIRLRNPSVPSIRYAANRGRRRRAANMMILPNRRHRRRNLANGFSFKGTYMSIASGAIGAGGSFLLNKFGISKITASDETDSSLSVKGIAMRGTVRALIGAAAAIFFPGAIGGAANGAMYYPLFSEIDRYMAQTRPAATSADLHGLEADLQDVLDDY